MPERAEIEAATQAIYDTVRTYPDASCARMARAALAAADRVRDARGDDEAYDRGYMQCCRDVAAALGFRFGERARSPQGEDHEAGPEPDALGGVPPSQPEEDKR